MSLNRSRPRWSPPPSSADMVPSSIEQSLQDWLSRSISDNSPMLDTICRCCGQPNCENFEALANTVRKLEGDARLAAEIGQSLLHKHETYVVEANQSKADLEQQLDEAREKGRHLEQLLEDADATRQELIEQNNKSNWEWQKTQKTLRETAADLEVANARCAQLANELRAETMEVDKLRIFKFMVRQADVREENLRAKLEDTKQELAIARKTELTLDSKHRKLKSRYETVCGAYERLKLNQQESGTVDNLTWLRESNEKLRRDVLKTTAADIQQASQQPHLITLIKELASANNKLKTDLLECRDLLSETRHEVITLNSRIEDLEKENSVDAEKKSTERLLSMSAPQDLDIKWPLALRKQQQQQQIRSRRATSSLVAPPKELPAAGPTPTASTSTPTSTSASIVHHHYHYHMQHRQENVPRSYDSSQDDDTLAPVQELQPRRITVDGDLQKVIYLMQKYAKQQKKFKGFDLQEPVAMKNSVSLSSQATSSTDDAILEEEEGTPYHLLKSQVTQTLQRLRATDIRALNRRLKRAFDILELSTMSNSIIENVLVDVEALRVRFAWIDEQDSDQEPWRQDVSMQEFFPTLQVMQDMLQEIGQLRSTMNDLQLEYVKKVEESGLRAEEEVLRKREIRRAANTKEPPSVVAWLTSVFFQRADPPPADDTTLVRSVSHDSILENERKTIRHKRSDIDRHGPPSSFPRVAEKRPSKSSSQPRPIPYPKLKASRSAGGSVRRSKSMQAPALEYAAVKRKKSAFNLNTSMVDLGTSPDIDVDWKVGGAFGATSWLGNK
ncbi:hypothetical protein BJV82DRAFT_410639 [Fennellomyces sp. T-0311]|nr:hypothetical protein BJV82DRAFT_410639 [Fennellomyces sp. T-0311]